MKEFDDYTAAEALDHLEDRFREVETWLSDAENDDDAQVALSTMDVIVEAQKAIEDGEDIGETMRQEERNEQRIFGFIH